MASIVETITAKPLAEALPGYVDFLRRQHVHGLPCRCGRRTAKRPMLYAGFAVRQLVSAIQSSTAPVLPSLACECGLQVCCCCGASTAAADAAAHAHACALKNHFCVAVCVESMRQIRLNIGVAKGPEGPPKPVIKPPTHEWQCQACTSSNEPDGSLACSVCGTDYDPATDPVARALAASGPSAPDAAGGGGGAAAAAAPGGAAVAASVAAPAAAAAPSTPTGTATGATPSSIVCPICTYENSGRPKKCAICDAPLPAVETPAASSSQAAAVAALVATTAAAPAAPAAPPAAAAASPSASTAAPVSGAAAAAAPPTVATPGASPAAAAAAVAATPTAPAATAPVSWACGVCTFENAGSKSACEVCGSANPAAPAPAAASGATSGASAAAAAAATTWTCSVCTLKNPTAVHACDACGNPSPTAPASLDDPGSFDSDDEEDTGLPPPHAPAAAAAAATMSTPSKAGKPTGPTLAPAKPVSKPSSSTSAATYSGMPATSSYSSALPSRYRRAAPEPVDDGPSESDDTDEEVAKAKKAAAFKSKYGSGGGARVGGTGYAGDAGETGRIARMKARAHQKEDRLDTITQHIVAALGEALNSLADQCAGALAAARVSTATATSGAAIETDEAVLQRTVHLDLALQLLVGPGYADGFHLKYVDNDAPRPTSPAAAGAAAPAASAPTSSASPAATDTTPPRRSAVGDPLTPKRPSSSAGALPSPAASAGAGTKPTAVARATAADPVVTAHKYCFCVAPTRDALGIRGGSVLYEALATKLRMTMVDAQSLTESQRSCWFSLLQLLESVARFPQCALAPVLLYAPRRDANARPSTAAAGSTATTKFIPWTNDTTTVNVLPGAKLVRVSEACFAGLLSALRSKAEMFVKSSLASASMSSAIEAGMANERESMILILASSVQSAARAVDKCVLEWSRVHKLPRADAAAAGAAATIAAGGWKVEPAAEPAIARTLSDEGRTAPASPPAGATGGAGTGGSGSAWAARDAATATAAANLIDPGCHGAKIVFARVLALCEGRKPSKKAGEGEFSALVVDQLMKLSRYSPPADLEARYTSFMRTQAYDTIDGLKTTHALVVGPKATGSGSDGGLTDTSRLMAVAAEMANLPDLAIFWPSSIFARTEESQMNLMRFYIVGPPDSPYANGFWGFDAKLPSNYGDVPPKVEFITTAGGTVRMNPNLYADGKVCLSLLGTWSGPGWEKGVSTLSQVLVSIQSAILGTDTPYANEPGYESRMASAEGKRAVAMHNTQLRLATVRYGMLAHLKSPPVGFEKACKAHFYLKRDELRFQLACWLAEVQAYAAYEQSLAGKSDAVEAFNRSITLGSHQVFRGPGSDLKSFKALAGAMESSVAELLAALAEMEDPLAASAATAAAGGAAADDDYTSEF